MWTGRVAMGLALSIGVLPAGILGIHRLGASVSSFVTLADVAAESPDGADTLSGG